MTATYGTQQTVSAGGGTSAVASDAFSVSGDTNATDFDSAGHLFATFTLTATFTTAPTAGGGVALFARPMDIDGTSDSPIPDTSFEEVFIGVITVDAVSTAQTVSSPFAFELPANDSDTYEFYLRNDTDQSLPAGWVLKATPLTP